jgi:hypothetical protein
MNQMGNKRSWIALLGLLLLPIASWSMDQTGSASVDPGKSRIAELRQELTTLLNARDHTIAEITERYRNSALSDRSMIEREEALLQEDYERQYLTLLIDYHNLTGNLAEMQKAQQMLAALNGVQPEAAAPAQESAPVTNGQTGTEGVIVHEQN